MSVLLDLLIHFLEYVKSIPNLYFYVGNISPFVIVFIYGLLLFTVAFFNRRQVKKYFRKVNQKNLLEEIPVTELPKEKTIEIRIDSKSKATPTLLGKNNPAIVKYKKNSNKPNRIVNPLREEEIVGAIDQILTNLKRLKLSNNEDYQEIIPVKNLVIDSQNLYYRLFDMDEKLFLNEHDRLLQAHIFMIAITGFELLHRLGANIDKPLLLETLDVEMNIKDKYLMVALQSDKIMESNIIDFVIDENLKEILIQGKELYTKAQLALHRMLANKNFNDSIKEHLVIRTELIKWCGKFIECDNTLKTKKKNLRK